jgi:hypothetical protein
MALVGNKTTGKAVADIKALYFYNHANGGEPTIGENVLTGSDSDKWFPVLTLRGTVTASQDAPSIEKINVDQFDAAIGISTEAGDFNFEAQLPSLTYEDVARWIGESNIQKVTGSGTSPLIVDGKQLLGFNLDGSLYDMSVLIKTRTNDVIIFPRVQVSFSFSKEDKVFLFRVTGQVLAPSNSANKMIYMATQTAAEVTADDAKVN